MAASPWLRLRKLMDVLIANSELEALDEKSIRLLEWIVEAYDPQQPLYVQRVITEPTIASQATLHKCLTRLIEHGMLQVEVDDADERRRRLSPTDKARATLAHLDGHVHRWVRQLTTD